MQIILLHIRGCVLSCFSRLRLCDPMDYTLPGSSDHRIFQARNWNGLPCPPTSDPPNPAIKPTSLMSPALAGAFFTTSGTIEAPVRG